MQQFKLIAELREHLDLVRTSGQRIVLVPTMGNLHAGHLALIQQANRAGEYIVVTIFVNPTQFVSGEDFVDYPRTLDKDFALLQTVNVHAVFTPETNELYGNGRFMAEVSVPKLDGIYCGQFRPGHFRGVATIVTKLLNIIQPNVAVFGEKDYQQLLIIQNMVRDLKMPVVIVSVPTVREIDHLAMSSRNSYLSAQERQRAPLLFQCLTGIVSAIKRGSAMYAGLEEAGIHRLVEAGFRPDYLKICDAETLGAPKNNNMIVIAAAWLGKARLIDNVAVHTYDQR